MDIFHGSQDPFKREGGVVECGCNWPYVPGDSESETEHAQQHADWEATIRVHGRAPMGLAPRERLKEEGQAQRKNGATFAERVAGGDQELRALFERSLDEASKRGFGPKHPRELEYIRMAAEDDILGDPDVSDAIMAKYTAIRRPAGTIFASYWEP